MAYMLVKAVTPLSHSNSLWFGAHLQRRPFKAFLTTSHACHKLPHSNCYMSAGEDQIMTALQLKGLHPHGIPATFLDAVIVQLLQFKIFIPN